MALNALVGALRVNLGLDSAQFETGVKKSQRQAQTFSSKLGSSLKTAAKGFAVVGAAATAMAAALAVPLKRAINDMDALNKAAQKVGASGEDLARLRFAADLSGVSAEQLEKGLLRLNVALGDMGRKTAPEASKALKALGIDGGGNTLATMIKLADKFASMPDGVEKSALAIKVFGKAGADLIPLLNSGGDGLQRMAEEAERFGLVTDQKTRAATEAFNDNLTRLETVSKGVTTQIAAGLVPALAAITDEMVDGVSVGDNFIEFGRTLGLVLINVAEYATTSANEIEGLVNALEAVGTGFMALTRGVGFNAAFAGVGDAMRKKLERDVEIAERFAALRDRVANFVAPERQKFGGGGAGNLTIDIDNAAVASELRMGYGDGISDLASGGLSRPMQEFLDKSKEIGAVLKNEWAGSLESLKVSLPDINAWFAEAFMTAQRFGEGLAQSLGQALVFGQSLGDALKNSIRAAAAELVTSGLLNLLLGERSSSGSRSGGFIGGLLNAIIPGFANGTSSAPGGLAMVGERGRELVGLPQGAKVWSNAETERMMRGGGESRVVVDVQPSPFFVTTVTQATQSAAASAVGAFANQQRRQRISGAFG